MVFDLKLILAPIVGLLFAFAAHFGIVLPASMDQAGAVAAAMLLLASSSSSMPAAVLVCAARGDGSKLYPVLYGHCQYLYSINCALFCQFFHICCMLYFVIRILEHFHFD